MVGEKLINRAFELVQRLEKEDIKKVKLIANKAIDQELRLKGMEARNMIPANGHKICVMRFQQHVVKN